MSGICEIKKVWVPQSLKSAILCDLIFYFHDIEVTLSKILKIPKHNAQIKL